jgi:pyruvate,orthophosphate dikinase
MSKKYVYLFSEGNATMRELLGGKGANLAEMTNIGLPVPQGFTITTEACTQYYEDGRQINDEIMAEVMKNVKIMEELNGKKFGDLTNPLLVSVRSGARASMRHDGHHPQPRLERRRRRRHDQGQPRSQVRALCV